MAAIIYGYPPCCIDHFVNKTHAIESNPETTLSGDYSSDVEGMWFCGTGYIACPDCRTLPKEEVLKGIQRRRTSTLPFPREGGGMRLAIKKLKRLEFHDDYLPFYDDVVDWRDC